MNSFERADQEKTKFDTWRKFDFPNTTFNFQDKTKSNFQDKTKFNVPNT